MFIKFATTNGDVLQSLDEDAINVGPNALGSVLTLDDGIIIVDRLPTQSSSQLETLDIINILRYLLQKVYPLKADKIYITLPRMQSNINQQAVCQSQFQFLSSKIVEECKEISHENIFNVELIHV